MKGDWTPIPLEGGWFRLGPRTPDLNGIMALLDDTDDGFSALHRLTVTEGWQWVDGDPLELVLLHPDGAVDRHLLSADNRQAIVPAGSWMGARTLGTRTEFSCWCTPAFTDECFELADRAALLAAHPQHAPLITAFTREPGTEPR